jgi:hypothetical protein
MYFRHMDIGHNYLLFQILLELGYMFLVFHVALLVE